MLQVVRERMLGWQSGVSGLSAPGLDKGLDEKMKKYGWHGEIIP